MESTNLLSRIEDAGLNASAPPQQRLLDGWLLRFSPGKAKRARCVNAIAPGRLPLSEKLSLCEEAYARVGLPLIVRITPFSEPPTLDETLRASGFERFDDTRVMVLANLSTLAPASLHLQLRAVGADEYAQAIGALRDSPPSQREAHAHRMRCSPVAYRGFVAERGGQTIACGQYVVEADVAGLYDVFTVPGYRGQGLAGSLCAELLHRARADGASCAYLQVEGDNHTARSVYARLGFADAYAYHYRSREPQLA